MVPEEVDFFCSEELFAAGMRNAFDRETGGRPLRKAGRGLPEKHYVARAVFFGTVENGSISRLVSKGGRGVKHLPEKRLQAFLIP